MTLKKRKRVVASFLSLIAAAAVLVGVTLVGNSYRFDQRDVTITGPEGLMRDQVSA